eukprot:COSAG06_NODE_3412_length_5381_cov_5.527262_6_plen_82_part_00
MQRASASDPPFRAVDYVLVAVALDADADIGRVLAPTLTHVHASGACERQTRYLQQITTIVWKARRNGRGRTEEATLGSVIA